MSSPLGEALIALGVGFDLVGCLGLVRLPETFHCDGRPIAAA